MRRNNVYTIVMAMFAIALILPALSSTDASATQVSQAWVDSHHGQHAVGVVADSSGNIYVVGQDYLDGSSQGTDDLVLIKYDLAGNRKWIRFGETDGSRGEWDFPGWITLDPTGNILVTGRSVQPTTPDQVTTWKYDPNGKLLWKNRIQIFGSGIRVATDSSGNTYVLAQDSGTKRTNFVTFKIDLSGKTVWTKVYNGPSDWIDTPMGLSVTPTGRVVVTGSSEASMVTIVYDTNGNELWRRQFSPPDPSYVLTSSDVKFGPNGEVYVGGSYLIKYDANGNQVWVKPDPAVNSHGEAILRLAIDPQGNILAIGTFGSANVTKFSPAGAKLWGQNFPGGLGNLVIGSDNAVYVTGTKDGGMYTVKYAGDGSLQWENLYDHTFFDLDAGNAIALDSAGNVVVAGQRPILTVRLLQNGSPAPTPTATKVPQPTATPVPSLKLHSGDLDRVSQLSTTGYWKATAKILVEDANHKAVSGVTVSGTWSGGYSGTSSCTTGTYGRCTMTTPNIRTSSTSVTFTVKNLTKSGYTYNATANHDPDGDSNGTTIKVNKP